MATGLFNLKQVNQAISQGAWSGYIAPKWVEYLCVAGGGGGGSGSNLAGGGAGAGGLLTGIVTVAAGASYTVTVGSGGSGGAGNGAGTNGVASVFGSISSAGGGYGSQWNGTAVVVGSGGSGGGGASGTSALQGAQGTVGQGNAGGTGFYTTYNYPTGVGGGGGAGTVGGDGPYQSIAGNGGAGIASTISGTFTTYAGGGGGGAFTGSGAAYTGQGGSGGGGSGGASAAGFAGSVSTGGGGGGAGYGYSGGSGGSGIVVVRYPGNVQFYTGGTVTYSNGYIVHNFTANGTLAPTTPTLVSEYQISRSLRFNSVDTSILTRTVGSGNRRTWTWSGWVKKSTIDTGNTTTLPFLFASTDMATGSAYLQFGSYSDESALNCLSFQDQSGGAYVATTVAKFRDVSAWYHIVCAFDTTQDVPSNRVKIYVNGVRQTLTAGSTFQERDREGYVNYSSFQHKIGGYGGGIQAFQFNGYMAEVNFVDGQALPPTSFGYVNPTTGIWAPAKFVGGYGTNGFYLNFSDNSNTTAATLGADYSGNGNNWTPNNFSVTAGAGNDSLVDSPTSYGTDTGVGGTVRGNYATFNPLIKVVSQPTLSNGNLLSTAPAGWSSAVGTIGVTSGKWYWEIVNGNSDAFVGICGDNATLGTDAPQSSTGTILYYGNTGNKRIDTVDTGYGSTFSTQTIGVALDIDGGTIVFYRDNVSQGSISLSSSTLNGRTIFPLSGVISTTATVNFGQRAFAYTAPSGFKALCTQNLPTPTIGATTATQANKYFDIVLRNGGGSSGGTYSTTVNMANGALLWDKPRNQASSNYLMDSVRGISKLLSSNGTSAEATDSAWFTNFGTNSYTTGATDWGTGVTIVDWIWAAGAGTTNTTGSITSTVGASATSGFSIVTYTGTGANATVGHGLGAVPQMMIVKNRGTATGWRVYQVTMGNVDTILLNSSAAKRSDLNPWNSTTPTSTVFSVSTDAGVNESGVTIVAYCFAPIAGYSAFGSYTGNASTDGTFVFTGFRPAYVMIKSSSAATDWIVYDAVRNTYNVTDLNLRPNTTDAESSQAANYIDLLSNGFKLRGDGSGSINASGATYIYMAFATSPFKYSLAR